MDYERAPLRLFKVLFAVVLLLLLAKGTADPDLWGHLRFGQDIVAAAQIPRADTYSFTSDRPWVNHEWLAEVLMATAYERLGRPGLFLLCILIAVASVWVLSATLGASQLGEPVRVGLLLSAFLGSALQFVTIRPQLFSVLVFAVLLWLLGRVERRRPREVVWLPALFACWSNLHGGWIVGLGVVLLWAASVAVRRTVPWRWAVSAPALAALGSLANPFGLRLWTFMWETVGVGRAEIEDWAPLWHVPLATPWWLMTVAVLVLAWRRRGDASFFVFLPAAVLALLSLKVVRVEPYFAMTTAAMLAPLFVGQGPARFPLSRMPTRKELIVLSLLVTVGVSAAAVAAAKNVNCLRLDVEKRMTPEVEAVEFMKLNHLRGKLLTWFDYGEYAIWHLSPALKVSYDGRRETVYSAAVQRAHMNFYFNERDARYADDVNADYVWIPNSLRVVRALERAGWVAIFRGSKSVIYSRHTGLYVQPASVVGQRCFPGP